MKIHGKVDIKMRKFPIKVGPAPIGEKMWEGHLRWYGHVQRSVTNAPVKKSELI